MRWAAWLILGALLACGRSVDRGSAPTSGGSAGTGGDLGGSSAALSGGGDAGDPVSQAGSESATAGSASGSSGADAGGAPSGGGSGAAALGGSGGTASGAGGAGAGGNAGTTEGGSAGALDAGAAGEAGAPSSECEAVECSFGTHEVCCVPPEVDPRATYALSGYSSDRSYLMVVRTSGDGSRCTTLLISYPRSNEAAIELPERHAFERGWDEPCGNEDPNLQRQAVGVLGALSYTVEPYCVGFDFTLFFPSDAGEVEAVRSSAAEVQYPGHPDCE